MSESMPTEPTPEDVLGATALPQGAQGEGVVPSSLPPELFPSPEVKAVEEAERAEFSKRLLEQFAQFKQEEVSAREAYINLLTPEQLTELERDEEDERAQLFEEMHPELFAPVVEKREAGLEIAQLEGLVDVFEAEHSLEALHAITDREPFIPDPVRDPAKLALGPIIKVLSALKDETNISDEKYNELKTKYIRLSQAVGIINKGKVDHTRTF